MFDRADRRFLAHAFVVASAMAVAVTVALVTFAVAIGAAVRVFGLVSGWGG